MTQCYFGAKTGTNRLRAAVFWQKQERQDRGNIEMSGVCRKGNASGVFYNLIIYSHDIKKSSP